MFKKFDILSPYREEALGALRISASLIFMLHGTQKILGFPTAAPFTAEGIMLLGGLIELIGGLLLAVGLFSRLSAFIMSGTMAVAYWMFHAPSDWIFPINNGGDASILYAFVFFYIFVAGPGKWSLDQKYCKCEKATEALPTKAE